ncbi:MarR family winged helix-turn-helix transcriptional regulator [Kutzneria sp. 744]|uniref:MarR family winged helix-turn-helix transcriptional regulator n=1 Tax=Kutzneria sp. (strain 744) TaxID=345341 RepID=UPI0018DB7AD7|nr:MarR family transcriptional regulator [Kutzneria sp. 744]
MSDEAVRVGLRYLSLAHRVRRLVDDKMVAGGLSLARVKILRILDETGPQRQVSLAESLGQAPRSVTQAVEALERDGLVVRTADPEDQRAKLVALTPAGVDSLAAGVVAGDEALMEIFGALGPTRLARLGKLVDALEEEL